MRCVRLMVVLVVAAVSPAAGCRQAEPERADKAPAPEPVVASCVPSCEGRECGSDRCRGSCGECPEDYSCEEGKCKPPPCEPDCSGKECAGDGCGGSCGKCRAGLECTPGGVCVTPPCKPDCRGRECGDDDCQGSCGICGPGFECKSRKCVEVPCTADCSNKVCGDDGCGGSCGKCPLPNKCVAGRCERRIAVGALVGQGKESWVKEDVHLGDLARKLGRPLAVVNSFVGFPADWSGECTYGSFPKEWADRTLSVNPVGSIMLTLLPQCGFASFVEGFEAGNPAYDATRKLAEAVAKFPGPVFLRFAHDMNTHWYPWATCYFGNDKEGCAGEPARYIAAFANFASVIHEVAPDNGFVVWSLHEWEPYWGAQEKDYPAFRDFYPGDDHVDWVGLSLYYQDVVPPRTGAFASRIRGFYEEFSSPGGHGKPMVIAETAVECRIKEKLLCKSPVGDYNSVQKWWEPWGRLKMYRKKGSAPGKCKRLDKGYAHLVLEAAPDEADPGGKPHLADYYVGGTGVAIAWEKGANLERGNVLTFRAMREEGGVSPGLQIELCDVDAAECPKDDECCEKGTLSASITIDATTWETYVVPLSEFKPTVSGGKPSFNWRRVRAAKLHLLASSKTDNLAPLHLDGMAGALWHREGGQRCDRMVEGWAGQVFASANCYEWPNLKMILWYHDRKEERTSVKDYRIRNFDLFSRLLSDSCFMGGFW